MLKCIYPGSFDPFTSGHMDVLARAAKLFDRTIVAVLTNAAKKPAFTLEERQMFIRNAAQEAGLKNIEVASFDGLTIEFARSQGAQAIIRGLRAVSDYEYEQQLAHLNKMLAPDIETVFLLADAGYSFLSSSMVKEIGSYGGDISRFVSPANHKIIMERLLSQ